MVEGHPMHERAPSLLVFLLTAPVLSAFAQPQIADPLALQICAGIKDVELPAQDHPTPEEGKALAGCVSADAYFGFGQPADPAKARKCAWVEMEKGDEHLAFGGRAIMMMIYANGKGAARDFDVALKLACEIGGAPIDIAGRVRRLARFKEEHWAGDTFSICDYSAGKFMYEQCAILQDRFDKVERDNKLNAVAAKWSAGNRKALHVLQAKAQRFFKVRVGMEIDLSGTLEVHEVAFLERDLVSSIEQFERGEMPKFSSGIYRETDAAMNVTYSRTQTGTVRNWGTVTREGIKKAQQAWIPYRDAWVAFGRKKYPGVAAESWKTWLTQRRIAMLDRFLH
jgi:uncharacterized protein YecT (DUF1311 family)